jgi:hypothetical protein
MQTNYRNILAKDVSDRELGAVGRTSSAAKRAMTIRAWTIELQGYARVLGQQIAR